jgi:hypothetical protein
VLAALSWRAHGVVVMAVKMPVLSVVIFRDAEPSGLGHSNQPLATPLAPRDERTDTQSVANDSARQAVVARPPQHPPA